MSSRKSHLIVQFQEIGAIYFTFALSATTNKYMALLDWIVYFIGCRVLIYESSVSAVAVNLIKLVYCQLTRTQLCSCPWIYCFMLFIMPSFHLHFVAEGSSFSIHFCGLLD